MIARALFNLTAALPCRFIDLDSKRYLERYWVGQLLGWTFYLHRFVSGDDERQVHDHPWSTSFALVLSGGYLEERLLALCPDYGWLSTHRRMFPGRVNVIRARDFHRVTRPRLETWTLFAHGPRVKSWGFYSRHSDVRSVLYHQPYDTAAVKDWQLRAPLGRNANRTPFGERPDAAAATVHG